MDKIVPLKKIEEGGYEKVICYPRYDQNELKRRLTEMRKLGVKALRFTGEKRIDNTPILGKGCVGIVILAQIETGRVALKIRRTDADRFAMGREAEMLEIANSVNVGPNLVGFTENFLVMDYIEGTLLPKWIEALEAKEDSSQRIRKVLREVLQQTWRLDEIGLDHGELSRAPKHIVIDAEDEACILDFETASVSRRVSNVTSVSQYLFISGRTAKMIAERIGEIERKSLIKALRTYKRSRTRTNFEEVLRACLL